ncbi:MAG: Cl-channel, voltage gated [Verrucomicrobiales bacterium]|nr:Cl-channel, voltage gated [Verrucomicrobiales bacterium]
MRFSYSPILAALSRGKLLLLSPVVGLLAGLAAYALYSLIALAGNLIFYHTVSTQLPDFSHHHLGLWVLVIPAAGGLIVGLMGKFGSSKIRGHGIPEAMEAVLFHKSRIAPRVAVLKPISTAIAIGTGGPFGAEGPIIQTGGAIGSLMGQMLHITATERKVLLACGAAGGMAATFSTPIAAVILAIELLLFEFKPRSFIPISISSAVATFVHIQLVGAGPMFEVPHLHFGGLVQIPFLVVLGLCCGIYAVVFSKALYWVEDLFEKLPFDPMWWPAIGGIGLGLVAVWMPRVLGVGYETISDILNARLGLGLLLAIMVAKALALLFSLGSGTSGGLLAPMFTSGAALGASFALLANHLSPSPGLDPSTFALVAMAAVFGAASRSTLAFVLFAFEITRAYDSILPLLLACSVASALAQVFMKQSIMTEKLARRGLRVNQDYSVDPLHHSSVKEVMDPKPILIPDTMTVEQMAEKLSSHDPSFGTRHAFCIVDKNERLVGIITRTDVVEALRREEDATVLEAGSTYPLVTYPDAPLSEALNLMLTHEIGRLPVVSRDDVRQIVGYLGRGDILEARRKHLVEEHHVETGWLPGRPNGKPINSSAPVS